MSKKAVTAGLVLLNKPAQISSFKVLDNIKKGAGTKKVGHTGTLDPFASGLLVVLVGKYTKFNPLITGMDKTYTAVYKFGEETDTLDPTGNIIRNGFIPKIEDIESKIETLTGTLQQKPPFFSAIKVNGKKAYNEARKGNEIDIPVRTVQVFKHRILKYEPPFLTVKVECSKGTYIRSLARDLGEACGTCAYVTELHRDRIGKFDVGDSVSPDRFLSKLHMHSIQSFKDKLPMLSFLTLEDQELERRISLGQQLSIRDLPIEIDSKKDTVLINEQGKLLAVHPLPS